MLPVVVVRPIVSGWFKSMGSAVQVCSGMLKSVIGVEGQTVGKALFDNDLQRVVFIVEVVTKIAESGRPAILEIEGPARILRISSSLARETGVVARERGIVKWVVRAAADSVGAFVAHIGDGGGDGRGELPLYGG